MSKYSNLLPKAGVAANKTEYITFKSARVGVIPIYIYIYRERERVHG